MKPSLLRSSVVAVVAVAFLATSCGSTATSLIAASGEPSPTAVDAQQPVLVSALDDLDRAETPLEEAEVEEAEVEEAVAEEAQPRKLRSQSRGERCEVEYLTDDLTSNRGNGLAAERLQVVVFYDGEGESSPELRIGVGQEDEVVIGGQNSGGPIETFGRTIETREYLLYNCTPNGSFDVSGVVPNGVIDGLAFAIMWRDAAGGYSMFKSNIVSTHGATYVGMWPLGFSRELFAERTPQITDSFGRETARGMIIGSALMPNGSYELPLPAST